MDDDEQQQADILMNLMPRAMAETRLSSLVEELHEVYKLTRMRVIVFMMTLHAEEDKSKLCTLQAIVDDTECDEYMVAMVLDDLQKEGIINMHQKPSPPEADGHPIGTIIWK